MDERLSKRKKNMKVSIIVPVYNVSAYIERCIKSVIAQTYTDIECILVDDCTPDDSIVKCQELIDSYSGPIEFKIIHHNHNRGLSAARNTGTYAATGEYIYFLDSDDEITPDCISLLAKETEHHPGVELVQGNVMVIPYENNANLSLHKETFYKEGNEWVRYSHFRIGEEFPVTAWNKLVRKDFLISNNLLFKNGIIHEDVIWTMQVVKGLGKYSIINSKTYIYYKRDQSITGEINSGQLGAQKLSAKSWMYICNVAFKELDEPYMRLQLFKYLWVLLEKLELGCKTKDGVMAMAWSIFALIRCGYKKLALKCFKYYLSVYTHQRPGQYNIKEDILSRWEKESDREFELLR